MSDTEMRRLLAEVLSFMADLDKCPKCVGPELFERCHEKRWRVLRGKIKKLLGNAPN
jgi:hypothetical protein